MEVYVFALYNIGVRIRCTSCAFRISKYPHCQHPPAFMPKFKLKSILSRVILGESWRERDSSDYLLHGAGFEYGSADSHSRSASDDDNEDDDRSSANSFSTTATTGNLPGAGRTIDTYIYQPVGRRIEKLAKRLASLSSRRRTCGSEAVGGVDVCSETATASADNYDSGSSINSFSTTATANNLPGTGRAVDTYIYQPMGRRIERLAMRFSISSLHPARITEYIEMDREHTDYEPAFAESISLKESIASLSQYYILYPNESTILAGIKGLVKQTQ